MSKLMGYQFQIQYKPGNENRAADALSRREAEPELASFSVRQYEGFEELEREVHGDEELRKIMQQIVQGEGPRGYTMQQGTLLYEGRLVLPRKSRKAQALIKEFHDSPMVATPVTCELTRGWRQYCIGWA